jgi:S1-C subfamily serine protease
MKSIAALLAAVLAAAVAASAAAADYKTLRRLNAGPQTSVEPVPAGAKARAVEFARIVVHPADGEAWAIAYESVPLRAENDMDRPSYKLMTWDSGASEGERESFARVFNDELKKAGFVAQRGESLFDESSGSADLKAGVLIDQLNGRFCVDCPNMFNRNGIPGTVVMTAHWEIYSSLDRRVVAKITTSGGADYKSKLQGNFLPVVFEGFRENVRQLLASEDFRRVVTGAAGTRSTLPAAPLADIPVNAPTTRVPVAQASRSVAVVYAADGQGSGFLISADGYLLTNQHVVGGSKYVKLKWSNGTETLGEVVRVDRRRDVALIKTDAQGRAPLSLRLGAVQQGETVFAIGTPLDDSLQNTMTKGIVSAERMEKGLRFVQSDAGINHGNSGGPLLDEKGAVVAIAVSGLLPDSHQMGLNFFIPIDDALKALSLTPDAATPASIPTKTPIKPKG